MHMPEEAATSLGSGMHDIVRTGSIGLRLPLLPSRRIQGEPCLFVPEKWTVEIVRVGLERLNRPRPLPQHSFTVNGRQISGRVIHVPRGKSIVLGRDPHPKSEQEQAEDQICIRLLRVGAEPARVSSAVISLVRLNAGDMESVYAFNGHYSKGRDRTSPKLSPFVQDKSGELIKHLNGPHVSKELSPGMEIVMGYLLDGIDLPRTYAEATERMHYLEDLVDAHPELRFDANGTARRPGAPSPCLAMTAADSNAMTLSTMGGAPSAVEPTQLKAGKSTVQALRLGRAAAASEPAPSNLLVGSDRLALQEEALKQGITADLAVFEGRGLLPAHARFKVSANGRVQVEPLQRSPIFVAAESAVQARPLTQAEALNEGTLLLLGPQFRCKLLNRTAVDAPAPKGETQRPRPVETPRASSRPSPPRAPSAEPLMRPRRTWFQRLTSLFGGS